MTTFSSIFGKKGSPIVSPQTSESDDSLMGIFFQIIYNVIKNKNVTIDVETNDGQKQKKLITFANLELGSKHLNWRQKDEIKIVSRHSNLFSFFLKEVGRIDSSIFVQKVAEKLDENNQISYSSILDIVEEFPIWKLEEQSNLIQQSSLIQRILNNPSLYPDFYLFGELPENPEEVKQDNSNVKIYLKKVLQNNERNYVAIGEAVDNQMKTEVIVKIEHESEIMYIRKNYSSEKAAYLDLGWRGIEVAGFQTDFKFFLIDMEILILEKLSPIPKNADVLQLGVDSLNWLESLHKKRDGVHSDIKPANIMFHESSQKFIPIDYDGITLKKTSNNEFVRYSATPGWAIQAPTENPSELTITTKWHDLIELGITMYGILAEQGNEKPLDMYNEIWTIYKIDPSMAKIKTKELEKYFAYLFDHKSDYSYDKLRQILKS